MTFDNGARYGTFADGPRIGNILANLNPEQLQSVTSREHPLIIIAGAGSGKTRVLTRRIAYRIAIGEAEARHTLAVTFTRKAAAELKQRLRALSLRDEIEAYTFHAAALRILQRFWESKESPPYELIDSKYRLMSEAVTSIGTTTKGTLKNRGFSYLKGLDDDQNPRSLVTSVIAEVEWAKARGISPSQYPDAAIGSNRVAPLAPSEIGEIYRIYEELKANFKKIDYDDLIIGAFRALSSDPVFAATERYRMRHLYVDEFQDINPIQMNLVTALLGDRSDLCVVGDPNQAIYSWNGAEPQLIASLPSRYPTAVTVSLVHNYRSTPQILAIAKNILATPGQPTSDEDSLLSNLPDGPIPVIKSFGDERAEARSIARLAKQSHQPGIEWSDIAILARTNAQLVPFQTTFAELGIPSFIAGESNYLARREVKDILAIFERQRFPGRGSSLYARLEGLVDSTLKNYSEGSPVAEDLSLLLELSREYIASSRGTDFRALVSWLRAEAQNATDASTHQAVTLSTFHKAKGLEWKVVFVVGMENGLVPIARADSRDSLLEELRLLYVAITRAKREITLSWARQRSFNERQLLREPSPYLANIQEVIDRLSGHIATPEHALNAIKKVRKTLDNSPAELQLLTDEQLEILTGLRLWRSRKSKEFGVPPHLVLHDTTIVALAIQRPSDVESLSKIAGIGKARALRFGTDLLEQLAK